MPCELYDDVSKVVITEVATDTKRAVRVCGETEYSDKEVT